MFVLHPDERHDGRQGTDAGYGYCIVYIAPELVRDALDGKALPFVADAVTRDRHLQAAVSGIFPNPDEAEDDVHNIAAVSELADAMSRLAGQPRRVDTGINLREMGRVREHLLAQAPGPISMANLEREHGIDRFSLSRQFRIAFGVSPNRFMTLRRLDIAKCHIRRGNSLADSALHAGFADQSHMTRQFRSAFGLSARCLERPVEPTQHRESLRFEAAC